MEISSGSQVQEEQNQAGLGSGAQSPVDHTDDFPPGCQQRL